MGHERSLSSEAELDAQLHAALTAAGQPYNGTLPADGRFTRYGNRKSGQPCWLVLYRLSNGHRAANFGDWRQGSRHHWQSWADGHNVRHDAAALQRELEQRQRQQDTVLDQRHAAAARLAADLWARLAETGDHPYLSRKAVPALGVRFGHDEQGRGPCLVIPLRTMAGALVGLQFIHSDGNKRFLPGTAKRGAFHLIGTLNPHGPLIVAEGYATAASVHQATGHAVAVAFDAGNLEPVAAAFRQTDPDLAMVVAADHDQWKPHAGNPGVEKAIAVARRHGTRWAIPDFTGLDTRDQPTDFNDLAALAGLDEVRRQLEQAQSPSLTGADARLGPLIQLAGGELHQTVAAAEQALLAAGAPLYQRSGLLVRPVTLPALEAPSLRRPTGTIGLQQITPEWLQLKLTALAHWQRFDRRSQQWREVDCPVDIARALLACVGEWQFPPLAGVIDRPVLRADGSLLQTPGYDPASGLLYQPSQRFTVIPEHPTLENVARALATLQQVLAGYQFATPADATVALAAILTALVRPALPAAPLIAIDAPTRGSGKSLLVDVVSIIATGRSAVCVAQGKDETEDEKRLGSALLAGYGMISIDNLHSPLAGDFLCSLLTQSTVAVRVLGASQLLDLPTQVALFATGNNIQARGDMTRRILPCRIDPGCECPEEREFTVDLRAFATAHRAELVTAGLTLLRAYRAAGRPRQPIKPLGSFEAWSDGVRATLVWLGLPDPCETRQRLAELDTETVGLRQVLAAWYAVFDSSWQFARDVVAAMNTRIDLKDALEEAIPSDRHELTARKLSKWLQKHSGRLINGLRIERHAGGNHENASLWRVALTQPTQPTQPASYASYARSVSPKAGEVSETKI